MPLCTLWGPFGGAQMPLKDHENKLFSGCFGPFFLQELIWLGAFFQART
jgi:hypothetical protein